VVKAVKVAKAMKLPLPPLLLQLKAVKVARVAKAKPPVLSR
jgi:hypothetical protein